MSRLWIPTRKRTSQSKGTVIFSSKSGKDGGSNETSPSQGLDSGLRACIGVTSAIFATIIMIAFFASALVVIPWSVANSEF